MRLKFEVDDSGLRTGITAMQVAAGDYRKPLNQFQAHMVKETIGLFNALRLGGSHRGVTWPYFKNPRYIRKTDGVSVPPWGGVPYARKKMTKSGKEAKRQPVVKGIKRPSGKRLKEGDAILQDTRTLLRSVTTSIDYTVKTPMSLMWGTRLKYAAKQNARRPFLFFTASDLLELERLLKAHLMGGMNGNAQS